MLEMFLIALSIMVGVIMGLAFIMAYFVARVVGAKEEPKPIIKKRELTPEEIRKAKRLQQEVLNMTTYNGDAQEEIHID